MEKVTYKELVSAQVRMDNSVDTGRTYDIRADVEIAGDTAQNFNNGEATKDGATAATWTCYGGTLNVTFYAQQDGAAVLAALNAFIDEAKAKAAEASPLEAMNAGQ